MVHSSAMPSITFRWCLLMGDTRGSIERLAFSMWLVCSRLVKKTMPLLAKGTMDQRPNSCTGSQNRVLKLTTWSFFTLMPSFFNNCSMRPGGEK